MRERYVVVAGAVTALLAACGPGSSNPSLSDMGGSVMTDLGSSPLDMKGSATSDTSAAVDAKDEDAKDEDGSAKADMAEDLTSSDLSRDQDMSSDMNGGSLKSCDELNPEGQKVCEFVEKMYDDRLAAIYCKAGFQCHGLFPQSERRFGRYVDEADCRANIVRVENRSRDEKPGTLMWRSNLSLDRATLYQSVEEGRIALDDTLAQSCLDALDGILASEACEIDFIERGVTEQIWECRTAMAGQADINEACLTVQDCQGYKIDASGSPWCVKESGAAECDLGRCEVPLILDAADCNPRCGQLEYCDRQNQVCLPLIALGEPCVNFFECGANRYCDMTAAEDHGLCAEYNSKAVGQACTANRHCLPGLVCDERAAPPYGSCAQPSEVVFGDQGEACYRTRGCRPGLVCRGSFPPAGANTCELPSEESASCASHEDCAHELTCIGGDNVEGGVGTCSPPRAGGESCTSQLDCISNRCSSGQCAPRLVCMDNP